MARAVSRITTHGIPFHTGQHLGGKTAPAFSAIVPVHAIGLNDTGQDTCYNNTAADSVAASDGSITEAPAALSSAGPAPVRAVGVLILMETIS